MLNTRGFSLVEFILSVAILAIVSSGAMIWFLGYQRDAELDSSYKTIIVVLRYAQARAVSGKDFKNWGVCFDDIGGKAVLFRDDGFNCFAASVKEENYLSNYVKIENVSLNGGANQIIFNNPKGNTAQYGTIRITEIGGNDYRDITITPLGKIE